MSERPTPPAGLRAAGHELWSAHTADPDVTYRPDELAVLAEAAKVADVIARLEEALADGPVLLPGSRGQSRVSPVIIEARLQRGLLSALLGRLSIPDPASTEGVAGEWDTMTASERARRAAGARWGR